MKKAYQFIAAAGLSLMAVATFAQSTNMIAQKAGSHHARTFTGHYNYQNNASATDRAMGSTTIVLNYDSADAVLDNPKFYHNQGELMNAHYAYPADTVGKNYDVVQNISVAFDSLVDAYNLDLAYTSPSVKVDTLLIPIVHNNTSGVADTLDVQLTSVDNYGYPSTMYKDTMIIGKKIGDTNSSSLINFIAVPENYTVSGSSKFAVTVTYKGAKKDSCWFIYGFPYFSANCQGGGPYVLANPTSYSAIDSGKFAIIAANKTAKINNNSFATYARYAANGSLPNYLFFYDCNGDGKFTQGTDGASYYQDINIYAQVTFSPTGINELKANGFSVAQNKPNPFNATTQITYNVTKSSNVDFYVSDMMGRKIVANNYSNVAPGQHVISLSANQFTPGIYFYTFNVNGNAVTKKMVITQ